MGEIILYFNRGDMGDDITKKAIDIAEEFVKTEQPVFVYVADLNVPVRVTIERLDEKSTEHQFISFAIPVREYIH